MNTGLASVQSLLDRCAIALQRVTFKFSCESMVLLIRVTWNGGSVFSGFVSLKLQIHTLTSSKNQNNLVVDACQVLLACQVDHLDLFNDDLLLIHQDIATRGQGLVSGS